MPRSICKQFFSQARPSSLLGEEALQPSIPPCRDRYRQSNPKLDTVAGKVDMVFLPLNRFLPPLLFPRREGGFSPKSGKLDFVPFLFDAVGAPNICTASHIAPMTFCHQCAYRTIAFRTKWRAGTSKEELVKRNILANKCPLI